MDKLHEDISQKEKKNIQMAKMLNIIKHWRSADQNHSKTSSPTYQNG